MTARNAFRLRTALVTAACTLHVARVCAATPVAQSAAPSPSTYALNARVFITGRAARQQGTVGTTQLKGSERALTTYLTYRDYRLVQSGAASRPLNQPLTLQLPDNASVAVSVVSSNRDLIKVQIVWKLPGQQDLKTKLNVVRNRATMIGGPRHPAGGIYLLSLTVK